MAFSPQHELSLDEAMEVHEGGHIDFWDYVQVARAWWWLIALAAALALLGTWLYERGRPPRYTAQVLLQKQEERSPLEALGASTGGDQPDMASQVEILKSYALLEEVVDSTRLQLSLAPPARRGSIFAALEVSAGAPPAAYTLEPAAGAVVLHGPDGVAGRAAPGQWLAGPGFRLRLRPDLRLDGPVGLSVIRVQDAVDALRDRLQLEQPAGTNLLRVGDREPDPALAASVANTMAFVYREQADARARNTASRRREFLAGQVRQVADSLRLAQSALAAYQQSSRILDPKTEVETLANGLTAAETEVRTLRFQEGVLNSLLKSAQAPGATDTGLGGVAAIGDDILPNGAGLYKRLQDLLAERSRLTASRYGYTSRGPGVEVLDSLIGATKGEMRSVAQQSLGLVQARLAAAEARAEQLRLQAGGLPARATGFTRLAELVDNAQKTFDLLADKYFEAQVAEVVASGDIGLLDPALVPLRPDPTGSRRHLLVALLAGALAGLGLAVLLERSDNTVRQRGQAEQATGLELLGMVPELLPAPAAGAAGFDQASAAVLDPYRALRTSIRFLRAEQPRVLAVTSQGPGEGKSTTAANLAAALAQSGARVLLADADLRRPTQHLRHGLPRSRGVSDVLVGDVTLDEAARRTDSGLYLLDAGSYAPNPGELLDSASVGRFIGAAREQFDFVVVDTPPVLAAPETAAVARASDGVVLVAQPKRTPLPALAQAAAQLRRVRAPLLGLVLNRVPAGIAGSGSYYQYYDYGRHYGGNGNGDGNGNGNGHGGGNGKGASRVARITSRIGMPFLTGRG